MPVDYLLLFPSLSCEEFLQTFIKRHIPPGPIGGRGIWDIALQHGLTHFVPLQVGLGLEF